LKSGRELKKAIVKQKDKYMKEAAEEEEVSSMHIQTHTQ